MDDVYDTLVALKSPDESFSDELRRLAKAKGSVMDFAGAWADVPEVVAEKMKARISERRSGRLEHLRKRL